MSFAENLKKLRIAKQYSQAELAGLSGVSQQLISFIERGEKTNPKWKTVVKLSNKLNVTPAELLGEGVEKVTTEELVDIQETGGE